MLKLIFSNTDTERLKILKTCLEQFERLENTSFLIGEENLQKLERSFLTFEKIELHNDLLREEKEKLEKSYDEAFKKAKLYFVHYFQALYMAIERGEVPSNITDYYNITFPFPIPDPQTGEELIQLSENLFFNDDARVANGGKYFANPSIGSVKVWVEKFVEVYDKKTNKFNVKQAEIENIGGMRQETDNLIYEICYILSKEFEDLSINEQIENIAKYGLNVQPVEEEVEQIQIVEEFVQEPVNCITEVEDEESKTIKKRRKKKNINQLQFSFFFPE
ncbi:MAG: hypothetical protein LBQ22_00580 [Bacteroidales bacterium]|jgi:hypothetical protein|nr:hypothetical protein [Bacteroidales bacterium]